jgi:hypothetical protein
MSTVNEEIVRRQIFEKMYSSHPYFPPSSDIFSVVTDVNELPYRRFFRGRPESDVPIVWEREAGYSPVHVEKSQPTRVAQTYSGGTCFQTPCSTILPCRAKPALSVSSGCVYTSP